MIFTTKNKELAIFGNTIDNIRDKIDKLNKSRKENGWFGENGALSSLFSGKKQNNILSPETLKQFDEFKEKFNSSSLSAEALAEQMENVDQRIIDYAKTCKNGEMTTEGFKASVEGMTFSAKAGKVALQALATVGNMIAMWAISKVLELAVKGIDNLAHSAEHCKERVDELMSNYQSAIDKANSNTKTIEELASRYEELSKGVNNLGENVSLSTDEYAEYNKIVNQIADMFPTMIQGYTNEGNAILSLKGNVEQLRDAYKEAQQEAYNMLIATGKDSGGNDIIANYQNQVNGANIPWFLRKNVFADSKKDGAKESIDIIKKLTDVSSLEEFLKKYEQLYEEYNSLWSNKDISTLNKSLQSLGIEDVFALTEEDFANIKRSAQTAIRTYQTEIDTALKSTKLLANAYLMTNEDYANLSDQCKNAASIMVNSLSSEMVDGFEDPVAVGRYVDGIVTAIKDNSDVQNAVTNLFSIDTSNMSISEAKSHIDEYVKTIADAIGEDPLELKIRLGFEDIDDTAKRLKNAIRALTDDHGMENREILNSDEYAELVEMVSSLTMSEAELCLNAINDAESITDAINGIKKTLESIDSKEDDVFPLSISDTITQLNTQLKPSFDALKSAYNDIFTDDGEFALNSIDILSTCDSIKSKLDELNETEGITVDFSAYEDFVRVLSDTESTEQDVEDAFDSLATSISRATLSGAEDFETMKAALEDLGVVNNELVAFSALVSNTEALKEAFDQANVSMDDFIVNTENGSVEATQAGRAFLEEKVGVENCTEALSILALHKELCNLQEMNTGKEVANLRTLAENAGYTGDVIKYLTELERIYQEVASGTLTPAQIGIKLGKAAILKNMIDNAANKIQYAPKVDWNGAVKGAAKAGKAAGKSYADSAKSALDSFKEALDNFMDAQEKALDAGKITFQEYCNTVSTYIREAYDSGKISAKDFWDYQGRFLEKQKSIYDKVVRAVTRKIDDELDKLKDKQDEIDKFYDSQISSLEKTKKLLQETNDERKRQTDLQKALYDMERAYNQRTVLQYSDEKGMHYVSDPKAIRDARENVASTRLEIQIAEIDKSISRLEELRDKEKSALEDIIEKLEDYKEKWNDVTSAYEEAQEDQLAAMILGQGWEADILSMRTETLTNFANDYIRIQQAIADAAWESANAQIAAQQAAMSAISNPSSTVPDKKETSDAKSPIKYKTKKYKDTPNTIAVGIKAGASHLANVFSNLKFHTGLRQGLVGSHSFDDDFKLVQSVGLKENEVLAILKKGEAVATQEQISNIADGLRQSNNSESQTVVINGTEYRPLQPGDKMYDLVQKFDAYLERINHNIDMLTPNSVYEHQRQMEDMAKQINYVSSVTNNNRNTQPVVNHINVTCPGVTSQQVAEQLGSVIGKELDKQFNGFHNYTDQMSRIR